MKKFSSRFDEALTYASQLHSGQVRKGREIPFISHLLGVAAIAIENGAVEDEAIAALLHDAVEDQGGLPRLEDIRKIFGDTVAEIVMGCTDSWEHPKPEWRKRKEDYILHLGQHSNSILLVSCSDKIYNARCILDDYRQIGDALWSRFKGGKEGTLWYYQSLLPVYQANLLNKSIVQELERVINELVTLVHDADEAAGLTV